VPLIQLLRRVSLWLLVGRCRRFAGCEHGGEAATFFVLGLFFLAPHATEAGHPFCIPIPLHLPQDALQPLYLGESGITLGRKTLPSLSRHAQLDLQDWAQTALSFLSLHDHAKTVKDMNGAVRSRIRMIVVNRALHRQVRWWCLAVAFFRASAFTHACVSSGIRCTRIHWEPLHL